MDEYPRKRKFIIDNLKRIKNERKKAIEKYNEINNIVEKYTDKERIKELYRERNKYYDNKKKSHRDITIAEEDQKKKIEESGILKKQLDKEMNKKKKQNSLIREKEIAENAITIVGEIIAEIKNGVRSKISKEMKEIFFRLIWKKGTFSDVQLSDSYQISLLNYDNFECLGSCGAAERELLALSFTLALHSESGFDAPLVIDTPISRISGVLRNRFSKVLKDVSKEKQIILYMTEDEYSLQVKDVFEPCASNKYEFSLINEEFVEKRCS